MPKSKSLASLTPTLLARKRRAKPAMRPQFQPIQHMQEATARQLNEDLGFDDMGEDLMGDDKAQGDTAGPVHESEVVMLKSAAVEYPAALLEVRRLQDKIASRLSKEIQRKPRRSALAEGRSAAFTLRLDADRHLELRLASALAGRSAQQLLTEALDHMIEGLPEVADLAARAGKRKQNS